MILQTDRLLLRELVLSDAQRLYRLNQDPEVIRFTGDRAFTDEHHARKFLESYDHYHQYGFGRWAVIEKESGEFLGWCGLKYDPEIGQTDLGFRFFKKHWNKGFATEAAQATLGYAFGPLERQTIVGRAMKANTASIRVLEKIGMKFEQEREVCHTDCNMIYKITASEFNRSGV